MNSYMCVLCLLVSIYRVVTTFAGNVLLACLLFLGSIGFLTHTPAYAQQSAGANASGTLFLTGTVMDPSHAVVPNAEITLIQPKGSVLARLRTDSQGAFRAAIPGPGNYKIEVSSPDFETLSRSVEVTGNATVPLTLSLGIRKATSSVSVSASARDAEYEVQESSTTGKINLPILLTPQSVEVVPRAVLQDQKVLTLDAATRNVSGVSTDFGFNGSSEPLLILRGFSSVSMTAMGAMSGSSTYYLDGTKVQGLPANMANVQSVEVVKGPESVLYGRSEPGGLVNVVTRPLEATPSFALEQTGSNQSTARTLGEISGPLNRRGTVLGRIAGSWLQNRSNRDFVRDKVAAITGNVAWHPAAGSGLSLMLDYTDQEYRNDYGIPADVATGRPYDLPWSRQFNNAPELSNIRPFSAVLEGWHRLSDQWRVTGRAAIISANSHEVDVAPYRINLTTGEDCIATANELCRYYFNARPRGQYRLLQENVELRGDLHSGKIRHQIVIGGDFYDSRKIGTMYLQQLTPINIFNPDFSPLPKLDPAQSVATENLDKNRWTSGILQDNISFGSKLHAVVALRLDGTSAIYATPGTPTNDDFFASPRVGLVYEVARGHAIYGQYQDAVNTNNGRDPISGKALAAEKSREYEVGYKFSSPRGGWNATVATYQLTKRNRADFTLFPIVTVVGQARSRGIELDVLGRMTSRLATILSYGYTDAVVTEGPFYKGTFLANVPRHSGSVWLRYAFDSHWSAGAGIFSQSARQGDIGNTFLLPGYAREDIMVSYAFSTEKVRHEFQVNVNNLLDKRYYTGSHQFVQDWIQPGASRTVMLTYRVSR